MKRFLMLAVGTVVVVACFFLGRSLSSQPTVSAEPSRSPSESRVVVRTSSSASGPQSRSRGPADVPALALVPDDDARGTLRLEGLVLDARELPVEGALVQLDSSSVAPVRTEKNGTFLFTGLP